MVNDTAKDKPELGAMVNDLQTVRERVVHLRRLMLVHSYIYYWMDSSVVSDHQWQAWANSLRDLQTMFGWEGFGYFDLTFKGWDGSTGCDLPQDPRMVDKARWLVQEHDRLS